jgi:hypothetical protein
MVGLEVLASMPDQFAIRRMIDRFNTGNLLAQQRSMLLYVLDEFHLGICRPGNQNRPGIGNGVSYALIKIMILGCVATADGLRLVVKMARWIMRVKDKLVDVRNVEMKHARFAVIDPNNRMVVMRHGRLLLEISAPD